MAIAVIDADVMVFILDDLYIINRNSFIKVIEFLTLSFNQIWISKIVKNEFYNVKSKKKRKKVLQKLKREYENIRDCPIKVSENERHLISSEIDQGESDAIMQIMKTLHVEKKIHKDIIFLSNDRKAIEFAENAGITVKKYSELREELREWGVELP